MIQSRALARLRDLLNEAGTTQGYYSDTQLYRFLDSATGQVIAMALAILKEKRRENRYARSTILEPLHTLDTSNTTTTTSGGVRAEYALPSDYLMTEYCELKHDDRTSDPKYPCVLVDWSESKMSDQSTFRQFTYTAPAYYIRAGYLGFAIDIAHGGTLMYAHYYYKTHVEVAVARASEELPVRAEAHEAIVALALAEALVMDDRAQEAEIHRARATAMIEKLG